MLSSKFTSVFAITCSIAMADYSASTEKNIAVVNAGSSGSRLFVYQYSPDPVTDIPVIKQETSNEQKVGIQDVSSDNLDQYLEKLFSKTNKKNINNIYFYSTAGMRKTAPDQRASLNKTIKKWLKDKFPLSDIDVQTIPGQEEALYAWLALNYKNKSLHSQGDTQGVLDMGGVSTQIVYEVSDKGSYTVKIKNRTYKLETASFLGLGLDAAINQYLNQKSCFPKDFVLPDGKKGTGDFNACTKAIQPLITDVRKVANYIILKPPINTDSFALISGFYYTASELNIARNYSIKNLGKKGEDFCKQAWKELENGKTSYLPSPFLWHICFDAALEKDLLTFGYRLGVGKIPVQTAASSASDSDWSLGVLLSPFATPVAPDKHNSQTEL